jgi:acyl-CoA oxidase
LGTLLTDNDVNSTWEGDNNVLLQQTSRFIFRNLQKLMKGQRIESEYLSFLSLDLSHVYEAKAPFTDKSQLRNNLQLIKKLFEHRTSFLVAKSVSKLQENGAKFGDSVETWHQTQVFYLHPLAIAFGEKVCLDELVKATEVTKARCAQTGELLSRLCELYVLSKVVNDLGTFRDHDYLTFSQAQIVKDYVLDLCNELADHSVRIIDAIAVPDQLHGSPFALRNGQIYKAYTDLVEKAQNCYDPPTWVGLIKEVRKAFA